MATENKPISASTLTIKAVTPSRWPDLEKLFGQRGACGGCWCMYWRLRASDFERGKGASHKRTMKKIVASGEVPGLIAYREKEPVGWCSIGPRDAFVRFETARTLKPVDDKKVWSVVCLFVSKPYRRRGVSPLMLQAAVEHARKKGAKIVEGYPYDLDGRQSPDPFVWTGLASAYQKAGFAEVLRRSPTRPIMRYYIERK